MQHYVRGAVKPLNSKFEPLYAFLLENGADHIPMSFREVEKILGFNLPDSARNYRAWWSNNPSNSTITFAWLEAGYETAQVDMAMEKLVFKKNKYKKTIQSANRTNPSLSSVAINIRPGAASNHTLFGALKGLLRIQKDFDLTAPSSDEWDQNNG